MTAPEVNREVEFLCPFCGVKAGALSDNLDGGEKFYGVIHYLPACNMFLTLSGDAYVDAVLEINKRLN